MIKAQIFTVIAIIFGQVSHQKHPVVSSTCALFLPYDPINKPKDPELFGLVAGRYLDGSEAFVGVGRSNSSQPVMPGRISTKNTYQGPGAYMTLHFGYDFDNTTAIYLVNNLAVRWVPTTSASLLSVPDPVIVDGVAYKYFIGRATVWLANGSIYTEVSKVHFDNYAEGMWFWTPEGMRSIYQFFEILACSPSDSI